MPDYEQLLALVECSSRSCVLGLPWGARVYMLYCCLSFFSRCLAVQPESCVRVIWLGCLSTFNCPLCTSQYEPRCRWGLSFQSTVQQKIRANPLRLP